MELRRENRSAGPVAAGRDGGQHAGRVRSGGQGRRRCGGPAGLGAAGRYRRGDRALACAHRRRSPDRGAAGHPCVRRLRLAARARGFHRAGESRVPVRGERPWPALGHGSGQHDRRRGRLRPGRQAGSLGRHRQGHADARRGQRAAGVRRPRQRRARATADAARHHADRYAGCDRYRRLVAGAGLGREGDAGRFRSRLFRRGMERQPLRQPHLQGAPA